MKEATKRKTRITPGWYQVGSTQTIGALGSVTFDYSSLSNLISDATTLGKTPMAIAQSVVINFTGTMAVSLATITCADIQRGCFYTMNQEIPQLKNKYFLENPTLSFMRQVGMVMNPSAVSLDSLIDFKKSQFHVMDSIPQNNPTFANAVIPQPQFNRRPNLLSGWRDDENIQEVRALAPDPISFSDVFTLPFCSYSGNVMNDRIPLTMIADPSNPWKVTITERQIGASTIRAAVFNAAALLTINVELWVYICYLDNDSPISIGNVWSCAPQVFTNNQAVQSHRYKLYGVFPDYSATALDDIAVPYAPANFQLTVLDNNIRVFDCNQQVFPLPQFSNGIRTIDHCNIGASQGANPWFLINPDGTTTRMIGPGSALAGTIVNYAPTSMRGAWSSMPVFPFFMNHLSMHGMPPNIISEPGCTSPHKVQIDGSGGNPVGSAFAIYLDDYYETDIAAMESYAANGKLVEGYNNSAWKPLIDNPDSPKSGQALGLVPVVLRRS